MKNLFTKLVVGGAVVLGLLFVVGYAIQSHTAKAAYDVNYIQKMSVSKGVSVGMTSTQLLPASSGRVYAVIVNDGSNPVYLSMNGSAAVANAGVRLNANGGAYEINGLNQYVGIINAIATGGTSNVTVTAAQ